MVFQMSPHRIQSGIRSGETKIAIIGLGQIGLPQALHFVREGASVIGVDIDERKISLIKQGACPSGMKEHAVMFDLFGGGDKFEATSDTVSAIKGSKVHILCLPTPLSKDKTPDFSALTSACEKVGQGLRQGNLVIVESTVYPGVTTNIIKPILEKESSLKAGGDFGLAYCSERIDPGNAKHRLDNTPRVIGGASNDSIVAATAVYGIIIKAPITRARNCQTAELVKLVENVYRDINIAFVNEIALLCEQMDIDVLEVLDAASTKWSFMPHIPGAGVGGTCIPINPYYLLQCARETGGDLPLVRQARSTNESMPRHMVELTVKALNRIKRPIKRARICILGLAYKADVDDCRGAPGEMIAVELEQMGAEVAYYDPLAASENNTPGFKDSLEEAVKGVDCIVITTDHSTFKSLDLKAIANLANKPLAIVDGRHILTPKEVKDMGIAYIGIGRSGDSNLNIWDFKSRLAEKRA